MGGNFNLAAINCAPTATKTVMMNAEVGVLSTSIFNYPNATTQSISTFAAKGSAATATVERAGLWLPNHVA